MSMITWLARRVQLASLLSALKHLQTAQAAMQHTVSPAPAQAPPPHPSSDAAHVRSAGPHEPCRRGAPNSPTASNPSDDILWLDRGKAAWLPHEEEVHTVLDEVHKLFGSECRSLECDDTINRCMEVVDHVQSSLTSLTLGDSDDPVTQPFVVARNCQASANLANAARHVIGRAIRDGIARMPHNDALELLKKMRDIAGQNHDETDSEALDFGHLTAKKAYAITSTVIRAVVQTAMLDARFNPHMPPIPPTPEAIEQELATIRRAMLDTVREIQLMTHLLELDGDELHTYKTMRHGNNTADIIGFAKVEELNIRTYKMIQMSGPQAQALASHWSAFRAEYAKCRDELTAAITQLQTLPNEAVLGDLHSLNRPVLEATHPGCPTSGVCPFSPATQMLFGNDNNTRAVNAEGGDDRAARWTKELVGVSPEATEGAADVLLRLRRAQSREDLVRLYYQQRLVDVLSAEQVAVLMTCNLPLEADPHRIGQMATADASRERVFGAGGIASMIGTVDL